MDVHRGQGDREILEQGGLRNGVAEKHCQNVQRGLRVGWPGFTLEETVGTNRRERFWAALLWLGVARRSWPGAHAHCRARARGPHTPAHRVAGGRAGPPACPRTRGIVG